jgi:hypothetical protein
MPQRTQKFPKVIKKPIVQTHLQWTQLNDAENENNASGNLGFNILFLDF